MLASGPATHAVTSGAALARLSVSFAITVKLRQATNEAVQQREDSLPLRHDHHRSRITRRTNGRSFGATRLSDIVDEKDRSETASTFTETGGLDHLCPALDAVGFFTKDD